MLSIYSSIYLEFFLFTVLSIYSSINAANLYVINVLSMQCYQYSSIQCYQYNIATITEIAMITRSVSMAKKEVIKLKLRIKQPHPV